ncbi:MAG: family peptidase [Herbinix sp.]|jgi:endoglucanase|nr:family peptidase [Herbinix sp.]
MLERLKTLSELYGVSGDETRVRKYILEQVQPHCDEVYIDRMGNLYAHKKGNGKRVMYCAHMDEVGMIVTGVLDSGLLAFSAVGLDMRAIVSKRVAVGKNDVPGIIGSKAIHLQTPEERKTVLREKDLYVDIGAKDKEDALKYVNLGDYISFTTKFSEFGDGLIKGKALDDRVGCAILMELLQDSYDCDFTAVFTVMEEIGLRGAEAAVYNVKPEISIALEGTICNDMPECPPHKSVTRLGKGAVISFMDGGTIISQSMIDTLKETAVNNDIPWQFRQGNSGGNDNGIIHRSLAGCKTGAISVPCRYIHSPNSIAAKSDLDSAYRLAKAFLSEKKFNVV